MKKNDFVDKHKQPDMVEDLEQLLKTIKVLEPYSVEFEENSTMKANNYPLDYKIEGKKH